jgi:two-component system, NarL family, sensor histidine kinase DegS
MASPWIQRAARRLRPALPPVRRREFWIVQALVVGIAGGHAMLELLEPAELDALEVLPISLNLLPVVYAALVFGLGGAAPTAAWATILAMPNIWLWHDGASRLAELWQAGLVIVVGLLVGYRVDREQRVRRDMDQAEREHRLLTEQYARRTLAAKEEERRSVARDIHDGPLQSVMAAWRRLDALRDEVDRPAAAVVGELGGMMEQVAADLRRFSRLLRPSVLDDLGLYAAVRAEVEAFGLRTGVPAAFAADAVAEPSCLSNETAVTLLRICQEALRNIEHHADATHVSVVVRADASSAVLTVTDDGRGIDALPAPATLVAGGQLGVIGMRERARLVGGSCAIHPAESGGTTVDVALPLRPS